MQRFYGDQDLLRLADSFPADDWPRMLCPRCERGTLRPVEDSIKAVEAADSASDKWRNHDAWDPDWIYGYFHGVLTCTDPACNEPTIASGDYRIACRPDPEGYIDYFDSYHLRFTVPALRLMKLPDTCPKSVKDRIHDASRVIWTDPGSAANRLRSAIEELLTAQKIPKTKLVSRRGNTQIKRRMRLSAQARIEILHIKEPEAANLLEAVKWIGNSGSHEGSLGVEDVLAGVVLLEHALHTLYDNRAKDLARIAKQINNKKGPVRHLKAKSGKDVKR